MLWQGDAHAYNQLCCPVQRRKSLALAVALDLHKPSSQLDCAQFCIKVKKAPCSLLHTHAGPGTTAPGVLPREELTDNLIPPVLSQRKLLLKFVEV